MDSDLVFDKHVCFVNLFRFGHQFHPFHWFDSLSVDEANFVAQGFIGFKDLRQILRQLSLPAVVVLLCDSWCLLELFGVLFED